MTEPDFKHQEQNNEAGSRPWLVVVSAVIGFVTASLFQPSLVWPFLIGFCVLLFLVWLFYVPQSSVAPRRATQKHASLHPETSVHNLAEALQYPLFILDARGNIRFANRSSRSVFGQVNHGDRIFIRFRQPDLRRAIEEALATRQAVKIEYNEAVPDDRWFSVEISPIPGQGEANADEDQRFLLGFHELTETKRIDQMRSDFIANASHELRTPLASLQGYLETLKGPAKNDEKARNRFFDIMLEQAERMSRLVNDLLSLSKIEMKSHLRPSGKVNLGEVLRIVVNSLEPLTKQMDIRVELHADTDFEIKGDHDELFQVFENLIENACKYGQDGKRIIVSLLPDDLASPTHAIVYVKDFGPGIAIEHQHRITERFYRVDVARSREKQGTGLGLAIVKHILQRHGCRLTVKSKLGEGAEFSVKFPLINSEEV